MSTNNGDGQGSGPLNIIIKIGSVATAITAIVGLIVLVMQMVQPQESSTDPPPSSSKSTKTTHPDPKASTPTPKPTPEPTPKPKPESTPQPSPSPEPTSEPSVPAAGTAVDQWGSAQIGDFTLHGEVTRMDPGSLGATDYMVATYQAPGGQEVQYSLAEFSSSTEATQVMQQLADDYVSGQGYIRLGEGSTDSYHSGSRGTYVWLQGDQEMVLWTEDNYLLIAEGPYPQAWDFFVAT